jgi:small subunit ribosomal protein S16
MSVKIRLARGGAKKRPFYHIVIANADSPRDGKFIERVGTYNPMLPQDHAERVTLVTERLKYWLANGAIPTDRVTRFLAKAELIATPERREQTKQPLLKKKAQDREAARAKAAAAAAA